MRTIVIDGMTYKIKEADRCTNVCASCDLGANCESKCLGIEGLGYGTTAYFEEVHDA